MDQDSDKNRAGGQRPRRDGEQRSFGRRDDAPRGDNRRTGGSRFGRDTDGDSRRNSAPRTNDRPESRSERPNRFDSKDSSDRRSDGPRRDDTRRGDAQRSDAKPRFSANRDDRRSSGPRSESRPRIDSPRFSSRPDSRNNDRPDSREDGRRRDDTRGSGPRRDGPRNDGPSRSSRFSKPGPTRVGGFQPEADERNRAERSRNEQGPRSDDQSRNRSDRRNSSRDDNESRRGNGASRYSAEQRKDSGERRTGRYEKAPNYNLDQRAHEQSNRSDSRRDDRSRNDSRRDDKPARPDSDRRDDRRTDERSSRPTGPRERYPDPQEPTSQAPAKRPVDDGTTRLNRYIANSGVCSRREADELIANGDISVNGTVVTEMGFRVKEGDMVKYGTKALTPERFVYVLLNKPKDFITTTDDPEERKTVMELVADAGNFRMYPVGRLDRKTTGLLLITNDGELADKLTHPSNNVRKIYQVEIDKPITEEDFETLKRGMELEDGPIKPDAVGIVTPDAQVIGLEIHSGRNRIVRRMFEQLGYDVLKLDRTSFAGLTKKELPRGKWRYLDPKEVIKLKYLN